ncbi:MAG: helix-turn-helix domain-containing protein [Ruminococcus sp.]|nr:helix-turn-helix domain-containing protein [Ruminococcus sp.]
MSLGNQLIKIRKDNKMSQEMFSEIFGVTRQTISNWENAKSYPDIETIIKISDYFNISLDILLKEDIKMIKEIDKNVRKNKILKVIIIILFIFIIIFLALRELFPEEFGNYKKRPGVVIVCRYQDEILQYHETYNKYFKYPTDGGSWSVGQSSDLKYLNKKIVEIKSNDTFKNIDEEANYILKMYEDTGATCQMKYYKNEDNYLEKAEKMQFEYLDMIEKEKQE